MPQALQGPYLAFWHPHRRREPQRLQKLPGLGGPGLRSSNHPSSELFLNPPAPLLQVCSECPLFSDPSPSLATGLARVPGRATSWALVPFHVGTLVLSCPGTLPLGRSCPGPRGPRAQLGREWRRRGQLGAQVARLRGEPGEGAGQEPDSDVGPAPGADGAGRGRVPSRGSRLRFRPRGAGRARGS